MAARAGVLIDELVQRRDGRTGRGAACQNSLRQEVIGQVSQCAGGDPYDQGGDEDEHRPLGKQRTRLGHLKTDKSARAETLPADVATAL